MTSNTFFHSKIRLFRKPPCSHPRRLPRAFPKSPRNYIDNLTRPFQIHPFAHIERHPGQHLLVKHEWHRFIHQKVLNLTKINMIQQIPHIDTIASEQLFRVRHVYHVPNNFIAQQLQLAIIDYQLVVQCVQNFWSGSEIRSFFEILRIIFGQKIEISKIAR